MKKIVYCLVLLASIHGNLCAQNARTPSGADKTFELAPVNLNQRFLIDLGKGNKMQVDLSGATYIQNLPDMDSLLRVFIHDIEPLKDSLQDELTTKRIDYVTGPSERKKIRLQQFKPAGSSFVIDKGELAALKLEQDTVNFIGTYVPKIKEKFLKPGYNYRVSIFINRISELPALAGTLNDKMESLKRNEDAKWRSGADGIWHSKNDHSISAKQPGGHIQGAGDYLFSNFSINIQNYKNYFVPSFSLGIKIIAPMLLKANIGIYWEPQFLFQNNLGKLQSFRNDFLTVTIDQKFLRTNDPFYSPALFTNISLGYLIRRQGEFYDKNTFRLGFGGKDIWGGKTTIEPILYFHDIFKTTTPGLRIIQHF